MNVRWMLAATMVASLAVACSENAATPERALLDEGATVDPPADGSTDLELEFRQALIPFADSEVFFEFNSTDDDLGFQLVLDGEPWRRVIVLDPDFRRILDFKVSRQLRDLGLTELRFESAEPSPAEVLALFEPGNYTLLGASVEGETLFGEGTLSLDLPPAPDVSPEDGAVVDPEDLVLTWEPIGGIDYYEVIVSNEDEGTSIEAEVSAETTQFSVPNEFMEEETEYKFEVIAVAENGNKTITEAAFFTK